MKNINKLCFIGMSGVGKSHWSNQLAASYNYDLISADQEIAKSLLKDLAINKNKIEKYDYVSGWLGYPWSKDYNRNSKIYLKTEETLCAQAVNSSADKLILDSSGSLIYCSTQTRSDIKANFLCIYLKINQLEKEQLAEKYISNLRPILWPTALANRLSSKLPLHLIKELYIDLINEREKEYSALADISIENSAIINQDVNEFFAIINQHV